ncbi:MAG: WYL domain-containing protein, partial [Pseudomonadota bacterium]
IDRAIARRHALTFTYTRLDGGVSERTVNPLGLFFWGQVWTLVAWCRMRVDFRVFRVDRLAKLAVDDVPFESLPGQRLADYLKSQIEEGDCLSRQTVR